MTSISNNRRVSVPTTSQTSSSAPAAKSSASAATAATGSSGQSSFEAGAAPNTFSGLVNQGVSALKDVEGGGSIKDFLSKYPTKSGLEQAKKDLDALRGKLSPDQVTAIENAFQAQQVKLGTQSLMNSIAEAVRSALKKDFGG